MLAWVSRTTTHASLPADRQTKLRPRARPEIRVLYVWLVALKRTQARTHEAVSTLHRVDRRFALHFTERELACSTLDACDCRIDQKVGFNAKVRQVVRVAGAHVVHE